MHRSTGQHESVYRPPGVGSGHVGQWRKHLYAYFFTEDGQCVAAAIKDLRLAVVPLEKNFFDRVLELSESAFTQEVRHVADSVEADAYDVFTEQVLEKLSGCGSMFFAAIVFLESYPWQTNVGESNGSSPVTEAGML